MRGPIPIPLKALLAWVVIGAYPAFPQSGPSAPACEAKGGASCIYVDAVQGDDSASGAFASPVRRPQVAIRKAKAGDFIYLRGGTFTSDHAYATEMGGKPKRFFHLGDITTEGWNTPSGAVGKPITIKSFPGETAVAKDAGDIQIGSLKTEVAYWVVEGLVIDGNFIHIWGGAKNSSGQAVNQVHHIAIRGNEIFNSKQEDRANAGLIVVDRGDWGGPSDIVIEKNRLHDLFATGCAGCPDPQGTTADWKSTRDPIHFGAVAALSCESYVAADCIGNGALTIRNNVIYNVPMGLFLKNPAKGPVSVEGNIFFNAQSMGRVACSNTSFSGNLVFSVPDGLTVGGFGGSMAESVWALSGHNFRLEKNTFVGTNAIVRFTEIGSKHVVRRNVLFGLTQRTSKGTFDTPGFLTRYLSDAQYPDKDGDLSLSELNQGNTVNENCFITPYSDFIAVSRYLKGSTIHLTMDQARATFGFDRDSKVVIQPDDAAGKAAIFKDPGKNDYRIKPGIGCDGMGADTLPVQVVVSAKAESVPHEHRLAIRYAFGRVAFALPEGVPPAQSALSLFDTQGKRVRQWIRLAGASQEWETGTSAPGLFFAKLDWPGGSTTARFHILR